MGLLNIDESKFKIDGIYARECPTAIIRLKDKKNYTKIRYFRLPERKPSKISWRNPRMFAIVCSLNRRTYEE
jgi:hypothetical protein